MSETSLDLTSLRDTFCRHPELGFQEVCTKEALGDYLGRLGIKVFEGCGFHRVLPLGQRDSSVELHADSDALPLFETSLRCAPSHKPAITHTVPFRFSDAPLPIGAAICDAHMRDQLSRAKDLTS